LPLPKLQAGEYGTLISIEVEGSSAEFLYSEGFRPGMQITALAVGSSGEMLVETPLGRIQLAEELVSYIRVEKSTL